MSGKCDLVAQYEKSLDKFYKAVEWNDNAERGFNYVSKRLSQPVHTGEENIYSLEPLYPRLDGAIDPQGTSVTIDAELQKKLLKNSVSDRRAPPSCSAEDWLIFTSEERKALYLYTLQHTRQPGTPRELVLHEEDDPKDEGDMSETEVKRRERDHKRRRQAYRCAASGSKTLTEVTREMISHMMDLVAPPGDLPQPPSTSDPHRLDSGCPAERAERGGRSGDRKARHHREERKRHRSETSRHSRHKSAEHTSKHRHKREQTHGSSRTKRY